MGSRAILFGAVMVALAGCAGCKRDSAPVQAVQLAPKTVEERFAIRLGDQTVSMQVAAQPDEMQKGLMYRRSMGAEEGMIFVFWKPQRMSFWMRNTEIPLDIGYLDSNGVLKEIYQMYPRDETPVRSNSQEIRYALEMNQGWFSSKGIKPGAQLDLNALAEALKARGLEPVRNESR